MKWIGTKPCFFPTSFSSFYSLVSVRKHLPQSEAITLCISYNVAVCWRVSSTADRGHSEIVAISTPTMAYSPLYLQK
jgi:hypothetical protein